MIARFERSDVGKRTWIGWLKSATGALAVYFGFRPYPTVEQKEYENVTQ